MKAAAADNSKLWIVDDVCCRFLAGFLGPIGWLTRTTEMMVQSIDFEFVDVAKNTRSGLALPLPTVVDH